MRAAVFGLALALLGTPATIAQEAANEDSGDAAAAAGAEPAPSAPEPPPEREDSPFDYEASEEISEDLSVSFPVDI